MDNNYPKRVQDYTTANLVLILINLLWIFAVLWTNWGIGAVMVAGAVLNHLIGKLAVIRRRRQISSIRRGRPSDSAPGH